MSEQQQSIELRETIRENVRLALAEDIGSGDISARLIDATDLLKMELLVREDAVLCGCVWFDEAFTQCDSNTRIEWDAGDGDRVGANSILCQISGSARALLSAERTALNFLQTRHLDAALQTIRLSVPIVICVAQFEDCLSNLTIFR